MAEEGGLGSRYRPPTRQRAYTISLDDPDRHNLRRHPGRGLWSRHHRRGPGTPAGGGAGAGFSQRSLQHRDRGGGDYLPEPRPLRAGSKEGGIEQPREDRLLRRLPHEPPLQDRRPPWCLC